MPEIKHNFTGGKMNKDVDQRLVPKGEYRDAMNIQVSTSEGSDVGTVQNILGNSAVVEGLGIASGSICVGAISDEKNDALYWFVREPESTYNTTAVQSRDIIFELKNGNVDIVFNDIKQLNIAVNTLQAPSSGNIVINSQTGFNAINVGDTFQLWAQGNNLSGNDFYTVLSKDYSGNFHINIGDYTNASWANYQASGPGELQIVPLGTGGVLKFPEHIITGINIIDDMLFWTDGITEPKKINISRSIEGTTYSVNQPTRLINPDQNISWGSNILIQEEHITVIKKAPSRAPYLKMRAERSGNSYGETTFNFSGVSNGDEITLSITPHSGSSLNYQVNDILLLKQINLPASSDFPVTDFDVRLVVISGGGGSITCKVSSLSSALNFGSLNFVVDLDKFYDKLYSSKFPRFSYRYKYSDGEYSTIGPFSEVAFMPGSYDFAPNKAQNLGMENKLRELTLRRLIPKTIPKDVVQLDILYKESNSPNVYLVDEIKPSNTAWINNIYEITSETIKATIASNQLLRIWDNVPKNALSQEISGNRIIYGNYEQNYNMGDYKPDLSIQLTERTPAYASHSYLKSIKSLRDYQVGVVYSDEYGRQTPVLTNSSGTLKVGKLEASKRNIIEINPNETPPEWAKYIKFYIKETSTEYYNLSLDRYFDAEDGNLWLSFPSADRNKVDLESSLYLKKNYNSAEAGFNKEKYKIIDIKNEAPEFIKTRRSVLGKIRDKADGDDLFPDDGELPVRYEDQFNVKASKLENTILENFHKRHNAPDSGSSISAGGGPSINNPLFVRITSFKSDGVGGFLSAANSTNWYEIDNVKKANSDYIIRLKKPFEEDAVWTNVGDITLSADMTNITDNELGLQLEIGQDIVQNNSVFQGRFFVKVFRDQAIEENIVAPSTTQNVQVLKTALCGYLKDFTQEDLGMTGNNTSLAAHAAEIADFNANGAEFFTGTPVAPVIPVPPESYWSHRAWMKIQTKLNALESRWVIDEAFANAEEPYWGSAGFVDYNETTMSQGDTATTYGGYHQWSTNSWTLDHNATTGWWNPSGLTPNYVQGLGHGSNTDDYEYFTIGSGVTTHTIDLSYIGTGRVPANNVASNYENSSISLSTMSTFLYQVPSWENYWKISNGSNIGDAIDDDARDFADHLQDGTFIRFTNDPNQIIYKITNVKKFYKLNYSQGTDYSYYPFASEMIGTVGNSSTPYAEYGGSTYYNTPHFSRRITYRLTLEASNAGAPIGTDGGNGIGYDPLVGDNVNTTDISGNFCPIEIVTFHYINGDAEMPEDPAVFETVPKEDTGLEIYHEASDTLPIDLDFDPNAFAPPGTAVTALDDLNGDNLLSGTSAVSVWSGNLLKLSSSGGFFIADFMDPYGHMLTFTRPDGSYTTATITGLGELIPGQPDSSYYAYISPNVANNKLGLGWHNCYSFGNGVESNRIKDIFNSVFIDNGPRVSSTLEGGYEQEHRKYGLIYSGIYNSISGVNNLNQFIAAEKITKDISPIYGSIQKLYAGWGQGGDLITLCEDRVLKILANKDALYKRHCYEVVYGWINTYIKPWYERLV